MTGAGGAGGSHARRHRAGASGLGRSADHGGGRTAGGGRKAGDGVGRTDTEAPGADVGAARVEGGAPRVEGGTPSGDGPAGNAAPGAGNAGDRPDDVDRRSGTRSPGPTNGADHPVRDFLRANPQLFVLLVICLVLGLGTFIVVLLGLVTAGSDQTTGEPSGAILGAHAAGLRLLALFG